MDGSFSWDDFNWLRQLWRRKLLVKGILRSDDAERCVAAGADGVILSNNGALGLGGREAITGEPGPGGSYVAWGGALSVPFKTWPL
jgi:(S)-mandelate dehydrogenase